MTTAMTTATAHHQAREVVAGVDTHANTHHVAVLSLTGAKLGDLEVTANPAGYRQLVDFVASFGTIPAHRCRRHQLLRRRTRPDLDRATRGVP